MLPKNLRYGSKVESAPAKSTRVNIAPQNGTGNYNLGDTIIVNIPTRRNLVLVPSESYFKYSIEITNPTNGLVEHYRWDSGGAQAIIQKLRIFSGSNLLEDIDAYGMLAKMLMDLQVNTPSTYGKYNVMAGTRSDIMTTPPAVIASAAGVVNGTPAMDPTNATTLGTTLTAVLNSVLSQQCVPINNGDYITTVTGGAAPVKSGAYTYCINLISMLGSLCQNQYIPLFAMDSAPLRLELQLVDDIKKMLTSVAGTSTITISNVEYIANFIELSDEAVNMIVESLQGEPLQFVLPSWRNYQFSYALSNSATVNIPIPAKFSSLKSLFITTRDRFNLPLYCPHSSVVDGLASYQFRLGSTIVPAKAPSSQPEFFAECLKAIASMGDVYHSPSIDKNSYGLNATVADVAITDNTLYPHTIKRGLTQSGSFYIGLDLENYANAPKDSIFAGYNSNTDDIYAMLTYGQTVGFVGATRYDAYACFDQVLVCANSTAFVRF